MTRQTARIRHPFRVIAFRFALSAALYGVARWWIVPIRGWWFWLALTALIVACAPLVWAVLRLEERWGWWR